MMPEEDEIFKTFEKIIKLRSELDSANKTLVQNFLRPMFYKGKKITVERFDLDKGEIKIYPENIYDYLEEGKKSLVIRLEDFSSMVKFG